MKTLFLLLKVYALELFGMNRRMHMPGKRSGKRMSAAAAGLLATLAVAGILAFATLYCYIFAMGLNMLGLLHIFPILVTAILSLLDLITTVARAPSVLIRTRDYDLVTAMPIPAWAVGASRVLRLYIINLATNLFIWLPAGGCYIYFAHPPIGFYPVYILCMLLAPLLPVAIAAVLGSLIASLSAVLGNGKFIKLALSMLFPLLIMYCSFAFSFNTQSDAQLFAMLTDLGAAVSRIWPPARLVGEACTELSMASLGLFAGISLGAFALFCLAYGKLFVKLVTLADSRRTHARRVAVRGAQSMGRALYLREVKRYLGCNIYVMNTAFGMLLSVIGVVAISFTGIEKLAILMELDGFQEYLAMLIPFLLAWLAGMSTTTGSSISLEGKSLWIARSAPISAFQWLMAKLYLSLTVTVPLCLIDAGVLALTLKLSPSQALLCALMPASYSLLLSIIGLLTNLRFHRFDWSNETVIVKQSSGAFMPVLLSMLFTIAPGALMVMLDGPIIEMTPWICCGAALGISALLLAWMKARAEKWVRELQ